MTNDPSDEQLGPITVGLIGIGSLGLAIARNLLERGHRVIGYRRSSMDEFVAAGGRAASNPREVAERSEVVLTCLPSGESVTAVIAGPRGLLGGLAPGKVVFELSTISLEAKEAQRGPVAEAGAALLDCAVSGNPNYMAARTAAIFVSGDHAVFKRHHALIADITDNISFVGDFGAGTALKLIASALIPIHTLAAAEAFAIATRAGVDRQIVFDAIAGTPASSGMFETRGKAMVTGEHSRAVTLEGYLKNIGMAVELALTIGGDYPLLKTMHKAYQEAVEAGYGNLDHSVMFDYLMREDD